jgi:hypothetical protein
MAHKRLWHRLSNEVGRKGVRAYCVAVGSVAVWQSCRVCVRPAGPGAYNIVCSISAGLKPYDIV